MKARLMDLIAMGEVLESQFGKVSVTAYNRKVVKTEAVKMALNNGSLSMADFRVLFKQELKLTDIGSKALEDSEVLQNCVKQIENERFNIFYNKPKKNENVISFPEPEEDDIPF